MDLDELQSVQSRERQTDSLQQLRESFYAEASEYVEQLRDARDTAAEQADDPWNNPEVSRLSDEISTAEQTVEAIYDRRIGKIVKKASLAAADMPTNDDGLTTEEQNLFDSLVGDIESNREHVLDMIAGEVAPGSTPDLGDTDPTAGVDEPEPTASESATPERTPPPEDPESPAPPADDNGVSAADVMGSGGSADSTEPDPSADDQELAASQSEPDRTPPPEPTDESTPTTTTSEKPTQSTTASDEQAAVDRTMVKITQDVGEILGVDEREYDLSRNDVVTLPAANAGPLVDSDAAEKME